MQLRVHQGYFNPNFASAYHSRILAIPLLQPGGHHRHEIERKKKNSTRSEPLTPWRRLASYS